MLVFLTVLITVSWAIAWPMLFGPDLGRPAVYVDAPVSSIVADVPVMTFDHQGLV